MTALPPPRKSLSGFLIELSALLVCFAVAIVVAKVDPVHSSRWNVILSIGFLLLCGTILANLVEPIKLPHLTAYIAVGLLGGPHVLHLVDHETVARLVPVNTLAISLIALAGGLELEGKLLIRLLRTLVWSNLVQCVIVGVICGAAFLALSRYIPFAERLPVRGLVAVAAIWGMLATSRSPSATLAILAQTKAKGSLSNFALAFVMSSDVVVVVLSALVLVAVRPLLVEDAHLSLEHLSVLGREIVGSVALGICLGLILAAYLRVVGRHLVLILLVLGFVVTDGLRYVRFDPLLAFLVTGFVVRNMSKQGERLLEAVADMSGVVFVVFFATAGAHLDLPLLERLWPLALAFFFARTVATIFAHRLALRKVRESEELVRYGWTALVSQAGVTLALTHTVVREYPALGEGFQSLIIATVAINEVVGPIVFKAALERVGETSRRSVTRDSIHPRPSPASD